MLRAYITAEIDIENVDVQIEEITPQAEEHEIEEEANTKPKVEVNARSKARIKPVFGLQARLGLKNSGEIDCPKFYAEDGIPWSSENPKPSIPLGALSQVDKSTGKGCYSHFENKKRIKCYENTKPVKNPNNPNKSLWRYQSHHIVQDAAVSEYPFSTNYPYSNSRASTVVLKGGSHIPGSPHDLANKQQINTKKTEGIPYDGQSTLAVEYDVAEEVLKAATFSSQPIHVDGQLHCAKEEYFKKELKVANPSTAVTKKPGNRKH